MEPELSAQFDKHLKALIDLVRELHDKKYGKMSDDMQTWMHCTSKFHASYIKSKNPPGWYGVFTSFYKENAKSFNEAVITRTADGVLVNDKWLRSSSKITGAKKGLTLYYDPKYPVFSIPFESVYLCAKAYAQSKSENMKAQSYPLSLIYRLYALTALTCKDPSPILLKNVEELKQEVDDLSPVSTGGEAKTSSAMSGLNDMLQNLMKTTGVNIPGLNAEKIRDNITGLFDASTANNIEDVFNEVAEKVGNNTDPKDMMTSLSEVLKTDKVQNLMTTIGPNIGNRLMGLPLDTQPTTAAETSAVEVGDPADQE
jgi:hypothetical protein